MMPELENATITVPEPVRLGPGQAPTPELYIYWHHVMLLMRRFEEKAGQLYGQQKIRGFCHLYIGQEAIVAGQLSASIQGDKFITAYRDHAHAIACGIEPRNVMAELYGKSTGCTKGKGGSMHMFSQKHNFYGGHGIVGAQIPLGAGMAFSERYRETGNVVFCSMGDGAVRQGALHETFSMAMLWKLPVVFICENNLYGMGTAVSRTTTITDLWRIGAAYDMPSRQVDGMDPLAVHEACVEMARLAREEGLPSFLEIKTYRYKGHSMSDPAKYRSRDEVDEFRGKDPIELMAATLQKNGWMSEEEISALDKNIRAVVDEAVQFAEDSPYPEVEEMYKDVYRQADYPYLTD